VKKQFLLLICLFSLAGEVCFGFLNQIKFPGIFYYLNIEMALNQTKKVALTFDDGPDKKYTQEVLDILKENEVKATFFFIGEQVELFPAVAKRAVAENHEIGNHSYDHSRSTKITKEELFEEQICKTQEIFKTVLDTEPLLFRPPDGAINEEQIEFLGEKGYKTIKWSIDTIDWDKSQNSVEEIVDKVKAGIHGGAIILFHSGCGKKNHTVIG